MFQLRTSCKSTRQARLLGAVPKTAAVGHGRVRVLLELREALRRAVGRFRLVEQNCATGDERRAAI